MYVVEIWLNLLPRVPESASQATCSRPTYVRPARDESGFQSHVSENLVFEVSTASGQTRWGLLSFDDRA